MSLPFTDNVTVLNAVTATATSDWIDISKRQQVSIQLLSSGISSGNGVFTVDLTNDQTNKIPVLSVSLLPAQATNASVYVTSVTLNSSTTTSGVYLQPGFKMARVKCVVTTDGAYSAIIQDAG